MNENTKNQWQKLDELRRTDPHICGGYYTKNFLKTYRPDFYAEGYDFFPEFVRVAEKNGEIICRLEEAIVPDEDAPIDSDECMLETSLGTFVSRNHGEFGGALKTPGGEMNGNFCDVFEAGGKIYAVDSLSHLGLASKRFIPLTATASIIKYSVSKIWILKRGMRPESGHIYSFPAVSAQEAAAKSSNQFCSKYRKTELMQRRNLIVAFISFST